MKKLIYLLSIVLTLGSYAQKKQMCVTVDDLPVVAYGITDPDYQEKLTRDLVGVFTQYQIPAIGYVNEGKLYPEGVLDSSKVRMLEYWLASGLELGNHTYSHMNYHQVEYDSFITDVMRGEAILKPLIAQFGGDLKYFRHPYLRSGATKQQSDSLKVFLAEKDYVEAPVTIANEDYLFAKAYHVAYSKGDSALMLRIGKDYVSYMEEKVLFFEQLSDHLYQRNIAQTLLTHANLLNAHYMDELAEMYIRNGYDFVSQAEILADPAYSEEVTVFADWGISWLVRWALSQGMDKNLLKSDPPTPQYVVELTR